MKKRKLILPAAAAAALLAVFGAVLVPRLFGFHSTGAHEPANALPAAVRFLPYFRAGDLCVYENGASRTLVKDLYDPSSEDPVFSADYAMSPDGQTLVFRRGRSLYKTDGKTETKISENVTAWRTSDDMNTIAFLLPFEEDKYGDLGTLFLWQDGAVSLSDNRVVTDSLRLSSDGSAVFYLRRAADLSEELIRLKDGAAEALGASSLPAWFSRDGSLVLTRRDAGDGLSDYTLCGKKTVTYTSVRHAAVSDDQSILYVLEHFSAGKGRLLAVDLFTGREKEIAAGVHFFDEDGVTNSSRGVLYSTLVSTEAERYDIFYGEPGRDAVRLVSNTTENALYNAALNNDEKTGYLLTYGARREDGGVYRVTFDRHGLHATRLFSGYADSLLYYEEADTASFLVSPDTKAGGLWLANAQSAKQVAEKCDSVYQTTYSSLAIVSGARALCFTDTLDNAGTLVLDGTVIAENVRYGFTVSPVTDRDFSEVYYLSGQELYLYKNGASVLLADRVDGLINVFIGEEE